MPDEDERGRRTGSGPATLRELYGRRDEERQAERYGRLAALLRADLDAPSGGEPELRFYSAPGRVELGGNHTDHNGGKTLCAAVSLDAAACATAVRRFAPR